MNKRASVIVFILFFLTTRLFSGDKTGQSVFIPRTLLTDSMYEQGLNNYWFTAHKKERVMQHSKNPSFFSVQPLHISSGNSDDLARYFLLDNKTTMNFKEVEGGDVASSWFSLTGSDDIRNIGDRKFDSTISLKPKRSLYGIIFAVHGNLDQILTGLFCEARAPFIEVRHELEIDEFKKNVLGATAGRRRIVAALNTSDWRYGKFSPYKMVEEGVDDVLLRLGYTYVDKNHFNGKIYGDAIIPFGEGTKGEFVFEPLVGSVHAGLGFGSSINWKFHARQKNSFSFFGDARYHYRFEAKEIRSFDLKANGPWSRYLLVAREGGMAPADGINFFTRDMDILPRGSFEFLGLFNYQHMNLHFELGYNLWARSSEAAELHDKWDKDEESLGIYEQSNSVKTASTATIKTGVTKTTEDSTFIRISESDLDLKSATHDSALSHKVFGGVSVGSSVFDFPSRIGVGTSYEFARNNTALSQWSMWFNFYIQY